MLLVILITRWSLCYHGKESFCFLGIFFSPCLIPIMDSTKQKTQLHLYLPKALPNILVSRNA